MRLHTAERTGPRRDRESVYVGLLLSLGLLLNLIYAFWVVPLGDHEILDFRDPQAGGPAQEYIHVDATEYITLGYHLMRGQGLSFPLEDPRPSAYRMPGYPLLLAILFTCTGTKLSLALVLQCVLLVGIFWLGYRIARILFSKSAAMFTLFCLILWPNLKFYGCAYLGSETLAALCSYGFLLCLLKAEGDGHRWRWLMAGAVLLGGAIMTRPDFVFFVPLLFVWFFRRARLGFRAMGLYAGVLACFLCPWTIRNYVVFDAFIPGTTGMGNVLVGAYQPSTVSSNPGGWNLVETKEFDTWLPEAAEVTEATIDDAKRRQGLHYMSELTPADWVRLLSWRIVRLWFPAQRLIREQSVVINLKSLAQDRSALVSPPFLVTAGLSALCLPVYLFFWVGVYRTFKAFRSFEILFYLFLFVNFIALAFWGSLRFRFVFEPVLVMLGCHALLEFVTWSKRQFRKR